MCICTHDHSHTGRKESGGGGGWEVKKEEHRSHVKQEPQSRPSETGPPAHPSQSLESHMQDFDPKGPEGTVLKWARWHLNTMSLSTLTAQSLHSLPSGFPRSFLGLLSLILLCLLILHKKPLRVMLLVTQESDHRGEQRSGETQRIPQQPLLAL